MVMKERSLNMTAGSMTQATSFVFVLFALDVISHSFSALLLVVFQASQRGNEIAARLGCAETSLLQQSNRKGLCSSQSSHGHTAYLSKAVRQ
eukprot:497416-Amphidinium_carterae.1